MLVNPTDSTYPKSAPVYACITLASKLLLYPKKVQVIVFNFPFYHLFLKAEIRRQLGTILEK